MMDFFYPRDHSLSELRKEGDSVIVEVNKNKSLPPIPRRGMRSSFGESESRLYELSSNTSVGPKDVNIPPGYIWPTKSIETHSEIIDDSRSDTFQGGRRKPPKTKGLRPATRMSLVSKYARTGPTIMIEAPFGPKEQESNELDGNRAS